MQLSRVCRNLNTDPSQDKDKSSLISTCCPDWSITARDLVWLGSHWVGFVGARYAGSAGGEAVVDWVSSVIIGPYTSCSPILTAPILPMCMLSLSIHRGSISTYSFTYIYTRWKSVNLGMGMGMEVPYMWRWLYMCVLSLPSCIPILKGMVIFATSCYVICAKASVSVPELYSL